VHHHANKTACKEKGAILIRCLPETLQKENGMHGIQQKKSRPLQSLPRTSKQAPKGSYILPSGANSIELSSLEAEKCSGRWIETGQYPSNSKLLA